MSEFLARHGAHILVLGGPVVLAAGLFAMLELTRPGRPRRASSVPARLLVLAWAGVATIHLAVIAEHFDESALLGTFFLLLSVVQYGYAVALIRGASAGLLLAGMVASALVVLLWAYTRLVAVPFGLGPRESVGTADLASTALELGTVVLAWIVLRRSRAAAGESTGLAEPGRAAAAPTPAR